MSNRYLPRRRYGSQTDAAPAAPQPSPLSVQFYVDDMAGASIVGSLLNTALESFKAGCSISQAKMKFLRDKRADALADLIERSISDEEFATRSPIEREARLEVARRAALAADLEKREAAERAAELRRIEAERQEAARIVREAQRDAERTRREASPEFIAKRKNQELLRKYEIIEHVEAQVLKRLMQVLNVLEGGLRLTDEDVIWLIVVNRKHGFRFRRVLHAHHRHVANTCIVEFKSSGDPWQAINASKHLRECDAPLEAIDLLESVPEVRLKHRKTKSAKFTTQGGALRDLGRLNEAQRMGEEAHALLPRNFRPCTLLGAVHIQQGHYGLGNEWYRKAEERGAKADHIESELRLILRGMPAEKRKEAVAELRRIDPARFANLQVNS